MNIRINRLTLLALLVALLSPAAGAATEEITIVFHVVEWEPDGASSRSALPQLKPGKYRLKIESDRRAKLKLIPQGSAAADTSHSQWTEIASISSPVFRTLRQCGAEDVGRRGTIKAGRKPGQIQISIPGRGGCDLHGTFRVDLGTK